MIKRTPTRIHRPSSRIDRLRPAAQPDWYKRFKQLAATTGHLIKLK